MLRSLLIAAALFVGVLLLFAIASTAVVYYVQSQPTMVFPTAQPLPTFAPFPTFGPLPTFGPDSGSR